MYSERFNHASRSSVNSTASYYDVDRVRNTPHCDMSRSPWPRSNVRMSILHFHPKRLNSSASQFRVLFSSKYFILNLALFALLAFFATESFTIIVLVDYGRQIPAPLPSPLPLLARKLQALSLSFLRPDKPKRLIQQVCKLHRLWTATTRQVILLGHQVNRSSSMTVERGERSGHELKEKRDLYET